MRPLCVIELPGLTRGMVNRHAPFLREFGEAGGNHVLDPGLPAVTMAGHATI